MDLLFDLFEFYDLWTEEKSFSGRGSALKGSFGTILLFGLLLLTLSREVFRCSKGSLGRRSASSCSSLEPSLFSGKRNIYTCSGSVTSFFCKQKLFDISCLSRSLELSH